MTSTDISDEKIHEWIKTVGTVINNFKVASFTTSIQHRRCQSTGRLIHFTEEEVPFPGTEHFTAQNSLSLSRHPSPATESVKGDPRNLPFEPATAGLSLEREKYAMALGEAIIHETRSSAKELTTEELFRPLKLAWDDFIEDFLYPSWDEVANSIKEEMIECSRMPNLFASPQITSPQDLKPSPVKEFLNDEKTEKSDESVIDKVIEKHKASIVTLAIKDIPTKRGPKCTSFAIIMDVEQELPPFEELLPSPAFKYPFELDTFQKQAILCLEEKKNVFVAAHTSAGKTVVAEYAIALSIKCNSTRCVYTSPIKALSNQKFRDFCMTFEPANVGILTGDVQVRSEAPCLIMTTEILLQMLYRGASMIRDIEWVIFDEVHYVNDSERGHVWEEVFIMLPEHVNLVLLSATVPNVVDFADWLGRTRNRPTHVVSTTKRPVPLEHYLYLGRDTRTMNEKFRFIDENAQWIEDGYRMALRSKKEREVKLKKGFSPQGNLGNENLERQIYFTVIRHLQKEEKLPVIVFTFSRKRCDFYAQMVAGPVDLTTSEEKGNISRFIKKSLRKLKKVDRELPQVRTIAHLLSYGLGVHHSGILPLLKEITEILFTEGLVRVLFATETFSMGINMPARTVIFDNLRKHDGKSFRDLESSEYIQMAGRAGRRGKDKTGNVYLLCKQDIPELSDLKRITKGSATPLRSQFRLTYAMLLNNLRAREHIRIESIMEKSFGEHEQQKIVPTKSSDVQRIKEELATFKLEPCDICKDLKEFCEAFQAFRLDRIKVMPVIFNRMFELKKEFVNRIILVETENSPFMLGVIVNARKSDLDVVLFDPYEIINFNGNISSLTIIFQRTKFSFIQAVFEVFTSKADYRIWREKDTRSCTRRPYTQMLIDDLLELISKKQVIHPTILLEWNLVDPLRDLKLRDINQHDMMEQFYLKFYQLRRFNCLWCPRFVPHSKQMIHKQTLESELSLAKHILSRHSLGYYPEYNCKLQVLKALEYVTDDDDMCLKTKGRIGCLLTEHELILTELLTENVFSNLSPPYIASLLSCLFFRQTVENPPDLDSVMDAILSKLRSTALKIAELQTKFRSEDPGEEILDSVREGLMRVVYEWAKGTSFVDIVKLTEVQEGIIVRCIQRLDSLLKDLKSAAIFMGDPDLGEKFETTSNCIRRDIVFATSLYIQEEDEVEDQNSTEQRIADLMI